MPELTWVRSPKAINGDRTGTYLLHVDGTVAGQVECVQHHPAVVDLLHAYVHPSQGGGGVEDLLVRSVLGRLQEDGYHIVPTCRAVAAWISDHPDYAPMIARGGR